MARHGIALTVLLSFAVGNIGWPVTAGNGQCRTLAGKSMCCCGDKAKVGNCGCCKGSVASANTGRGCCDSDPKSAPVKLASCCQKKKQKLEPAHNLALKCACGDSPLPGFLVSSQPKLQTPPMRMPDLAKTAVVSSPMTRAVQQGSLSPETPPPRPSVA